MDSPPPAPIPSVTVDPGPAARSCALAGWTVHEYDSVTSTNLVAAAYPAWHAVRARSQTAGRGRFQRSWVSDEGGLWLSAVVPVVTGSRTWRTLPLLVGLAACEALRGFGVAGLRMRWPNDVLVHDRKIAGLLIDQFSPGLAVAGMGINVRNSPGRHDPALVQTATRVADELANPPSLEDLASRVLSALRQVLHEAGSDSARAPLDRLNRLWGRPRNVELDLHSDVRRGLFAGVDAEGRLILTQATGETALFEPSQVRHLAEI